ncbi:MAG TPA: glycosyltransferase, partial [Propionibacteriaceae bacterium]|nr:glycosyltransferase [Propionibacteriaceae bacterium]
MTEPPRPSAAPWALGRNLPIIASVAARHLDRGSMAVSSALLRALPTLLRSRLTPSLTRVSSTLGALSAAASGQGTDAAAALSSIADQASATSALRSVDGLVVLHRTTEARVALDSLKSRLGQPEGLALTESRLLAEEGHLTRALQILTTAARTRARGRLVAAVSGELSALDASTRICSTPPAAPAHRTSEPTRALHLVTTALPEAQTGYTIRTQGITSALVAAGMSVDVVSRLGFPVDRGSVTAREHVQVDNVSYHRLLPAKPLPRDAGARLDATIRLVTDLAAELSPDVLHAHSMHGNAQVALAVGRAMGLPVVYEVRGFLEETWRTHGGDPASDRYRLSRDAETVCMLAADAVVTLSESMASEIRGRGVD